MNSNRLRIRFHSCPPSPVSHRLIQQLLHFKRGRTKRTAREGRAVFKDRAKGRWEKGYFLTSEKYLATVRTNGLASSGTATSPFRISALGLGNAVERPRSVVILVHYGSGEVDAGKKSPGAGIGQAVRR